MTKPNQRQSEIKKSTILETAGTKWSRRDLVKFALATGARTGAAPSLHMHALL